MTALLPLVIVSQLGSGGNFGLLELRHSSGLTLTLNDDICARFGTDLDYQLCYDSGADNRLELRDAGGNLMLHITDAGTSGNLVVTGAVTSTGVLTGSAGSANTQGAVLSGRLELPVAGRIQFGTHGHFIGGLGSVDGKFIFSNNGESAFVYVQHNGEQTLHTDEITFCGQGPDAATTVYLSPRGSGLFGDAACDAEDSTTEATADEVWSPYDFQAVSMECGITDAAADAGGVTFAFRDDTSDASADLTCTTGALDGSGFASCEDLDNTPPTVAAGSAIAVRVVATTANLTAADIWCRVSVTR